MLYNSYVVGASFVRGLALHYYEREKNNKLLDYNCTNKERFFNYSNAFPFLVSQKLNISWPIIIEGRASFYDEIDYLSSVLDYKINYVNEILYPKIVLIQLSNPQRDFIFEDKCYKINFESTNGFGQSIDEITKDKPISFVEKFNKAVDKYINFPNEYDKENWEVVLKKLNSFILKYKTKNVITKIINYYAGDDIIDYISLFEDNSFVTYKYNNKEYYGVQDLVNKENLRVCDDITHIDDEHPNFKAHQIVADNVYESIINHKNWF